MGNRTWRDAMHEALYGDDGFYHRPEGGPGHHFRTSSSASVQFARAVVGLLDIVDDALGRPDVIELVEVAAARGALLTAVAGVVPEAAPHLLGRLRITGIELAARPDALPAAIAWHASLADRPPVRGLLLANEWLDNVPLDVVIHTADGPRLLHVDNAGNESPGGVPAAVDLQWLQDWWPSGETDDRAEIGLPRDQAWADAVERMAGGLAVAIDYGHVRTDRDAGAYAAGSLTGYRDGRQVAPVPDGSCDITAHVALDSVAAAGSAAAGAPASLTDQRTALRALGVSGGLPDRSLASADPRGYLQALQSAGQLAELTARGGLGDFGWVLQPVGLDPHFVKRLAAPHAPNPGSGLSQ
ncbi:MAG: SAM-dependent methyltransferase [Mycobacteriales bacterium]